MYPISSHIQSQVLKQKCSKHPQTNNNILHLSKNTNIHRICLRCVNELNISKNEIIDISKILGYNPALSAPLLPTTFINSEISALVQQMSDQTIQIRKQMKKFFEQFIKNIQASINKFMMKSTQQLQLMSLLIKKVSISSPHSAQVQKLQKILYTFNSNVDSELHQCIIELLSQSSSSVELNDDIDRIMEISANFEIENANLIEKKILDMINKLNIFSEKISQPILLKESSKNQKENSMKNLPLYESSIKNKRFNLESKCFIPSKFNPYSIQIKIEQNNKEVVFTNVSNNWEQCYFDYQLNKNSRYIINLSLNNIILNIPQFQFGLMEFDLKDSQNIYESKICYYQYSQVDTIMLKGKSLYSGQTAQIGKKMLQLRFCQCDQIFIVSSSDFKDVAIINDQNNIKLNKQYIFAFKLANKNDQIIIHSIEEVEEFDDNI